VPPAFAAVAAALAVGALPRIGWIALATAAAVLTAPDRPGVALAIIAGALVPPLLVRGSGRAWSLPAAAPVLGLIGLAVAYPALAGRARSALQRAALGAAGLWWLLLAQALLADELLFAPETSPEWATSTSATLDTVLGPPFATGLVAIAAVWALAALLLPWLVRGHYLGPDVVGASAWAAGLGSGTAAVAEWAGAQPPRGLAAGAIAAGILALLGPRLLPRDIVDP
jgi:hypothetical protein